MITAYVDVPLKLSRAMDRVATALKAYAPRNVEIVSSAKDADLVVLHVIGMEGIPEVISRLNGGMYAIIQYCISSTHTPIDAWLPIWNEAEVVWSYYDLPLKEYYHAPLGVDKIFTQQISHHFKTYGIMTSGFVAGSQEAIDYCYKAAEACQKRVMHIGPEPVGMPATDPRLWGTRHGIPDSELATLYSLSEHVSGLRWTEGFELPVIEGAACGARPICFDLPVYRQWFDDFATFVPHDRDKLHAALVNVMREPRRVTPNEQKKVIERFAWKPIIEGFWERVV